MPEPTLRPSDATNLAGIETGREHLSHSRLSTFLACHRKYELHYQERLEPISKPEALSMGSAFQKAIEHGNPEAGPLVLDGYTHASGALWEMPEEPLRFYTQEAEDKHRVQQAIVQAAAALYLRTWPVPLGETREFEYVVRLRNPWTGHYSRTFDLKGYADGVITGSWDGIWPDDAQVPPPLELVENKLSSRVDNITVQRLPLDRQVALARYGLWRATGRQVSKVHYRWIKKPSIKQKQKESLDEYLDRIRVDYEQRPEFYAIEEQPKFVGSDDLLRIECELWTWAEQLRALRRQRIYDRNTAACGEWGGCKYLPICGGDPDAMSLFQTRPER